MQNDKFVSVTTKKVIKNNFEINVPNLNKFDFERYLIMRESYEGFFYWECLVSSLYMKVLFLKTNLEI